MRLIDADALYTKVQELEELARKRALDTESTLPFPTKHNPAYTRYSAQLDERTKLKHMIADAPTVHPDSLVRPSARWMSVGHKMARICSHCFSDEPYKFADHDADIYDFCPHCGYYMGGEE